MTDFVVTSRIAGANTAQLFASTAPDMSAPLSGASQSRDDRGLVRLPITGLTAGERYYYSIGLDGGAAPTTPLGAFRVPGHSHKVAFSSCSQQFGPVINAIAREAPDFFIHMGDLHYADIATNDENVFLDAMEGFVDATPRKRNFHRNIPLSYIYDDHDYGPNDSGESSPSKLASVGAYRRRIPYSQLELGADEGVYRSITIGRVVYIITDQRFYADGNADPAPRELLGATQKAWFKSIFTDPANSDKFFVWVCSRTFHIDAPETFGDDWTSFSEERTELFDHMNTHATGRCAILVGDSHQLGIDDGTNNNYSTGGLGAGIPLFMASPLDSPGWGADSATYSNGLVKTSGHFGLMEVEDDGTNITINWRGYDSAHSVIATPLTFVVTPPTPIGSDPGPRPTPTAARWRLEMDRLPGQQYIEMAEIQLRTAYGGVQTAIHGTSGTATASSEFAGYPASAAFNNSTAGNGYSTAAGAVGQDWIEFEYNTPQKVAELLMQPAANNRPSHFRLYYYDTNTSQYVLALDPAWDIDWPGSGLKFAVP